LTEPTSGPEQHGQSRLGRLGVFVATFGYVGYAPIAPGTFGSAAGLAVYALVRATGSTTMELAVIAVLFAIGIWAGTAAEQHFGGVDPGPVVMDEVVGMLITLATLDVTITGAIVGFFIFRVLDVIKPWPSAGFERLPGGLGVMADDGMAALYGNLAMRGLIWITPAGWLA
jgi:phosphatidylglycerophosphatase A